ncbi:TPA: hypothetical protein ACNV1K_003623 [Klebsiella aerogenes]
MKAEFSVKVDIKTIVKTESVKIDQLFIKNSNGELECLGFVAFNDVDNSPYAPPVITPFTINGEMKEAHCAACAASALFAGRSNLYAEDIQIESSDSPIASLLAGVFSEAVKRQ